MTQVHRTQRRRDTRNRFGMSSLKVYLVKGDAAVLVKLTGPQASELKRLAERPRGNFGKAIVRVQNTLMRLGLARVRVRAAAGPQGSSNCDEIEATPAGRAWLEAASRKAGVRA